MYVPVVRFLHFNPILRVGLKTNIEQEYGTRYGTVVKQTILFLEHRYRIDQIPSQLKLLVITRNDALCWSKKQKYIALTKTKNALVLVEDDPIDQILVIWSITVYFIVLEPNSQ